MLGAAVALALLIYLGSHVAICGARSLAATKTYRRGVQHAQALSRTMRTSSLTKLRKMRQRRSDASSGGSVRGVGLGSSARSGEAAHNGGLDPTKSGGTAADDSQFGAPLPITEDLLRRHVEEMVQRLLAAQHAPPPA